MLLEKPDDEPLGWLPQTYHQMDLKKRKDLGSPESIVRGLVRIRGLSAR
jgi:hypothetical protein